MANAAASMTAVTEEVRILDMWRAACISPCSLHELVFMDILSPCQETSGALVSLPGAGATDGVPLQPSCGSALRLVCANRFDDRWHEWLL